MSFDMIYARILESHPFLCMACKGLVRRLVRVCRLYTKMEYWDFRPVVSPLAREVTSKKGGDGNDTRLTRLYRRPPRQMIQKRCFSLFPENCRDGCVSSSGREQMKTKQSGIQKGMQCEYRNIYECGGRKRPLKPPGTPEPSHW